MFSNSEAASLGMLLTYAMDMHVSDRASLAPAPDTRLTDWKIVGYITATDSVFRAFKSMAVGGTVYYGYLVQSIANPDSFVAVIRGTDGIVEWIEDAEFASVDHPTAGKVEAGFFGIYGSMQYRPIGVGNIAPMPIPAARGIANAVGQGSVMVIGHSLGSALATYLTFDLAHPMKLDKRVRGCFFASPRPGNADFAKAFAERVSEYSVFDYTLDVVPRIPMGPDYCDLLNATYLEPHAIQARIGFSLDCHHHIVCYCSMLSYTLLDWLKMPPIDLKCVGCIKGPA